MLEVGCGSGAISYEMAIRGFQCVAVETSERALNVSRSCLKGLDNVVVTDCIPGDQSFNYLMSFEVLEHIQDDYEALETWLSHLAPGGSCLLSVPANKAKWNITDVAAGHVRRYDRKDIEALVTGCGLVDINIITYGWPFTAVIEKVRCWVKCRQLAKAGVELENVELGDSGLTGESGVQRDVEIKMFPLYGSWLGRKLFYFASLTQRLFFRTDLGISYLVSARKPSA